jgi:hypothetical protein
MCGVIAMLEPDALRARRGTGGLERGEMKEGVRGLGREGDGEAEGVGVRVSERGLRGVRGLAGKEGVKGAREGGLRGVMGLERIDGARVGGLRGVSGGGKGCGEGGGRAGESLKVKEREGVCCNGCLVLGRFS